MTERAVHSFAHRAVHPSDRDVELSEAAHSSECILAIVICYRELSRECSPVYRAWPIRGQLLSKRLLLLVGARVMYQHG